MTTQNSQAVEAAALPDTVAKALRTAFSLGQTYWQQADSEYTSQHKKADVTRHKFQTLVDETVAALSLPHEVAAPVGITRAEWIAQAKAFYVEAGDDDATARECARYICNQQDWAGGELGDPREEAQEDIHGRGRGRTGLAALAASRVPGASPAEPVPKLAGSPFESYVAQVIHAAFADGWGSCRDAEFAGDEAMNDAFNQSATLGVCLSIDQSPTHPVGAGGAGVMDARPETMEIRYETFGNCLWHTDCKVNSFKSGVMQVLSHEKTSSTMKCLSCGQVGAYPKGRVGTVCVPVISTDAAILASKGGDQGAGK